MKSAILWGVLLLTARVDLCHGDASSSQSITTTSNAPRSPNAVPPADSLEQFSADVTRVLKELRAETYDPTVNPMFHKRNRPTFAVTWTHEMWSQQTSRWRFVNSFLYWHQSALLKRIMPQLLGLMVWTFFAIRIVDYETSPLSKMKFPMTSLSLVSGFVASLLALRSNQGLSRLMEARLVFGKVVLYTRDMASIITNFICPHHPQVALKLARHLCLFSWVLKNFVRGKKVTGTDEDIVRVMLPSTADADYVLRQRKMPVAIVMRLRQALAHLGHGVSKHRLSTAEELAMDHTIQAMDQCITLSEKLVASPIPPLFTTHAGRLLVFYLFFLPIALYSSGSLDARGTYVTVLAVGFAMLGLDEISYLMEQPFKLSPLYHLCKNSMRDVADALCLRMPDLDDGKNKLYEAQAQPYWAEGVEELME